MQLLPIFPLKMVVFPGEKVNLHVFEPRYKQLVNECYEEEKPFAIPFYNKNSEIMYELICYSELKFPKHKITTSNVSQDCMDLIAGLLDKNVNNRIGRRGIIDIKNHPFFNAYNLDAVNSKKSFAPLCKVYTSINSNDNNEGIKYEDVKTNVYKNEFGNEESVEGNNIAYKNEFSILEEDSLKVINDNEELFKDF